MRPQVGKRAAQYKPPKEKPRTRTRLFVESRMKHNIATKEDYLIMRDVATAINMNALEQRIIARKRILNLARKELTRDKLIGIIEKEIDLDRHRLTKYHGQLGNWGR
ncbi:MAG: hypothetical protein P8100_06880 [bacterium]|jgi:hypothetical protein